MGLDMYLERRTHVQNWDHTPSQNRYEVTLARGKGTSIDPKRITSITEEVAYWRKANAVHKWFVDNVQEGKDDCQEYRVGRDQLVELKAACDKVLAASKLKPGKVNAGYTLDAMGKHPIIEDGEVIADPQIAETVLPTTKGFFFGCTDYDDGYHQDIQYTSDTLAELLAEEDNEYADFYYHASW